MFKHTPYFYLFRILRFLMYSRHQPGQVCLWRQGLRLCVKKTKKTQTVTDRFDQHHGIGQDLEVAEKFVTFRAVISWKIAQSARVIHLGPSIFPARPSISAWWWLEPWNFKIWFPIQLGMSSSQLAKSIISQRGRYTTNQIIFNHILTY